ncbi:MAG: CBS and ACT domain-containing protein [Armatimonadota bacterium]|nr:CBS and ACT domain-containing protein [Armatimonadota bacterium]
MIVRSVMIEDVTTVAPDTPVRQAFELIETKHFDCLPVRDEHRHLVGVIQLTDIYEACMRLGRDAALALPVRDVMVSTPVTVSPEDVVERAAALMREHDVPLLPVVEHGELVGIITESDIFQAFQEMLGAATGTGRLTLVVPDRRGALARIAEIIRDEGISITHVATFYSKLFHQYKIVIRVETQAVEELADVLDQHGYKVIHKTVD